MRSKRKSIAQKVWPVFYCRGTGVRRNARSKPSFRSDFACFVVEKWSEGQTSQAAEVFPGGHSSQDNRYSLRSQLELRSIGSILIHGS